jgi:hypothetical protein
MGEPYIPVLTGVQVMAPAMPIWQVEHQQQQQQQQQQQPYQQTAAAVLSESSRSVLMGQGYTTGLIEAMENNCKRAFSHSIWVVDNSGSMQTLDGQRIVVTNQKYKFVETTRWSEMQQTVDYHAQLAALLEFTTTFRLLNDPGRVAGPQVFAVTGLDDLPVAQRTMEQCQPGGVTPLTRHLREIRDSVRAMEQSLRINGTKVNITLATDGTPTDEHGKSDAVCKQVRLLLVSCVADTFFLTRKRTCLYGFIVD